MEQNEEMNALLREQNQLLRKQLKLSRVLTWLLAAMALMLAVALALVVPGMNRVNQQVARVMEELEQADLPGMLENVNTLVTQSQDSLTAAMEKINGLDLESLNQAVSDLASLINNPLGGLFGMR